MINQRPLFQRPSRPVPSRPKSPRHSRPKKTNLEMSTKGLTSTRTSGCCFWDPNKTVGAKIKNKILTCSSLKKKLGPKFWDTPKYTTKYTRVSQTLCRWLPNCFVMVCDQIKFITRINWLQSESRHQPLHKYAVSCSQHLFVVRVNHPAPVSR